MSQEQIMRVLELAEKGELPEQIVDDSIVPVMIVKELHDDGRYLTGTEMATGTGIRCKFKYTDVRITLRGREYLQRLRDEQAAASLPAKFKKYALSLWAWIAEHIVAGIIIGIIVAWFSWKYFS